MYDYTVNGNDSSRDFMLIRMDRSVDAMVKSTKELETQLDSYNFTSPANTGQRDAEALAKVRESLRSVLAAQKVELDAMSGFVETCLLYTSHTLRRAGHSDVGEIGGAAGEDLFVGCLHVRVRSIDEGYEACLLYTSRCV